MRSACATAAKPARAPRTPGPSHLARISPEPASCTLWRGCPLRRSGWQAPGHVSTFPGLASEHSTRDVFPPDPGKQKPLLAARVPDSQYSPEAPPDRPKPPVEVDPELPGVWLDYSGWSG